MRRATRTHSGDSSTPVTRCPFLASSSAIWPGPEPTSSMRDPGGIWASAKRKSSPKMESMYSGRGTDFEYAGPRGDLGERETKVLAEDGVDVLRPPPGVVVEPIARLRASEVRDVAMGDALTDLQVESRRFVFQAIGFHRNITAHPIVREVASGLPEGVGRSPGAQTQGLPGVGPSACRDKAWPMQARSARPSRGASAAAQRPRISREFRRVAKLLLGRFFIRRWTRGRRTTPDS